MCGHAVTVTVENDPVKSAKAGWLNGEFKAPE